MSDNPYAPPPPDQQPYGQPPYAEWGSRYPMPRNTNGFAIASLVCAFLFPPLGVIFGFVARSQIRQTGESGEGLALAGIIVSAISLVLSILLFVAVLSAIHNAKFVTP